MKSHEEKLYKGRYYTIPELAEMAHISKQQMYKRLKTMTTEEAMSYIAPPKYTHPPKLFPFKDQMLSIKEFCELTGKNSKTVSAKLRKGMTLEEIVNEKKERHTNNRVPSTYLWHGEKMTISQIAECEQIDASNLYRRLSKGMSISDAISVIKKNKTQYYPYRGKMVTRQELLLDNPQVSETKLRILLCDDRKYTEDLIEDILVLCTKDERYKINGISLYQFCLDNQYNYMSIYYLIKRRGFTVEEAIAYYIKWGQNKPVNGTLVVGEVLLNHLCIMEKISKSYIDYYLYQGYSFQDAVIKCCFNSRQKYKTRTKRRYLGEIYRVWEMLEKEDQKYLEEHYYLDNDDVKFIEQCQEKINQILQDYDLLKIAYYLNTVTDDPIVYDVLKKYNLSIVEAIKLLEKIYDNFELIDNFNTKCNVKYMWRKEQ